MSTNNLDGHIHTPGFTLLRAVALAASLLTGGCLVGPNYQHPQVHAPAAWIGAAATTASQTATTATLTNPTAQVALAQWWGAFNDPALNGLIERGLQANLNLQLAVERITQARAVVGETTAGFWPTGTLSSEYQRSQTHLPEPKKSSSTSGTTSGSGATSGSGTTAGIAGVKRTITTNLYRAGFDAAYELDIFGGVRRGVEASRADLRASVENARDARVTLTGEIGADYLDLRGFQEQLRITRENLATQQHSVVITRQRFEAGFVSGLDVANAEAQVATTQAQIPPLETSIQQTIYQLGLLLGEEPGALLQELTPDKPLPAIPLQIPAGLPSELLQRRPDIRSADEQLHAATARVGVAVADLFPKFTLNGSTSIQANSLASWNKAVTSLWSFGPAVQWNVFDGFLRWNKVKENRSLAEQALITYRQTVLTAFNEVETAWVAFNQEVERARQLEVAVERNSHADDLANQLYIAGQSDFLSVLDAQRSLYATQSSLAQSRTAIATDLVAIYKALGGGWQTWPLPAAAR